MLSMIELNYMPAPSGYTKEFFRYLMDVSSKDRDTWVFKKGYPLTGAHEYDMYYCFILLNDGVDKFVVKALVADGYTLEEATKLSKDIPELRKWLMQKAAENNHDLFIFLVDY
jgi:hypothetical protein